MKKTIRRNQIFITGLALMIAIAGYTHFSKEVPTKSTNKSNDSMVTAKSVTTNASETNTEINSEKNTPKSTDNNENSTAIEKVDVKDIEDKASIGEAILVNASINADFFYSAKLNREQVRAKNKSTLLEIVNNDKLSAKQKEKASAQIIAITRQTELENEIETMLNAKGYENTVVSVGEKSADVIVDASKISSKDAAIIEDVVKRKTGFASGNVVITPTNAQ